MSIERAKKRQGLAGESLAAIGRMQIEPVSEPGQNQLEGVQGQVEAIVEILGLQTRTLSLMLLCQRDMLLALENRDADTETGPDDEIAEPPGDPAGEGSERERSSQVEPAKEPGAETEPGDEPGAESEPGK